MGDFNHPMSAGGTTQQDNKQSRRFLKSINDKFLFQVIDEPMRRGVLLDLIHTNKEGPVGHVKIKVSLG